MCKNSAVVAKWLLASVAEVHRLVHLVTIRAHFRLFVRRVHQIGGEFVGRGWGLDMSLAHGAVCA